MSRVYKRAESSVKWWIDFRVGGKRFREKGGRTRQQAEAALAKRFDEETQAHLYGKPVLRGQKMTVHDLRLLWLEHAHAKRSLHIDKLNFDRIEEYFKPEALIANIEPVDVDRFRKWLKAQKPRRGGDDTLAPATVNLVLFTLRSAFRLAERSGVVTRKPCDRMQTEDTPDARDRICSREEYEALKGIADAQMRAIIVLGYRTGIRLGQITGLTWERVFFAERIIKLTEATKNKKGRRVPLHAEAIEALQALGSKKSGPVFAVSKSAASKRFVRLTTRLKIKDLRFHDFRHTACTLMRRAGVDIFTIAKIVGHRDMASMQRYQTIDQDDLLGAVDRVA